MGKARKKVLLSLEKGHIIPNRLLIGMDGKAHSDELLGGNKHSAAEQRIRSHHRDISMTTPQRPD